MKPEFLLMVCLLSTAPAWSGFNLGLGSAAARQGTKAIEASRADVEARRLPTCSAVPYTVSPLSVAENFNIEPLGHLAPYSHTFPTEHIYFILIKSTDDVTAHNVYAPADLFLTRVVISEYQNATSDYSLTFGVCEGMDGYFHHIKTLDPELADQIGPVDGNCSTYSDGSLRTCSKELNVRVSAGEVVGTVSGSTGSSLVGLDFGTHDQRTPALAFANQSLRFSTTAVSLGTTSQWWMSSRVALQGTALAGVGYGSAGTITPQETEGDFHYGTTPQGALDLRLLFGHRAALSTSGQAYYITDQGAGKAPGTEHIKQWKSALMVRLVGRQAVGLNYELVRRKANYDSLPNQSQHIGTVSVTYNILSDMNLGVVNWGRH